MTYVNPVTPAPRKLSLACLFSFIFGLLGCIPFAGGVLAIVFAIVGFVRTAGAERTGRWMAIVGLILGILSIGGWGVFGGGIWALWKVTEAPRIAAHDYIRDLSTGDVADCMAHSVSPPVTQDGVQDLVDIAKKYGTFKDTTFTDTKVVNDDASLSGEATFSGGTLDVDVDLRKVGGEWKIKKMSFTQP